MTEDEMVGWHHRHNGHGFGCAGYPGESGPLGLSDGEGIGNPLQYSCLENPMDGGAWWAAVHGVARVGHD